MNQQTTVDIKQLARLRRAIELCDELDGLVTQLFPARGPVTRKDVFHIRRHFHAKLTRAERSLAAKWKARKGRAP